MQQAMGNEAAHAGAGARHATCYLPRTAINLLTKYIYAQHATTYDMYYNTTCIYLYIDT